MTNDKDDKATYIIDSIMRQEDGVEVTAAMKSLGISMHQIVLEKREVTPDYLHYYFIEHISDLFQFAKTTLTTSKLQMILETLQQAETVLKQEEEAEPLLAAAWQLMRKVVSQEEVEKISVTQIEIRPNKLSAEAIILSGPDTWEQANHILQQWSTPENEEKRVEYVISYSDGFQDGRWLKLPLFYTPLSGEQEDREQIEPDLDLGKQLIAALNKNIDLSSANPASFYVACQEAVTYLRHYAVGGSACAEEVTTSILRMQDEQWSHGTVYRSFLHAESRQSEGSLFKHVGGKMFLHATYTPSDTIEWGYQLHLAGIYDLQVVKRLATGQEVVIEGGVQDVQSDQTHLDFSVLPGDENPSIQKDGETLQITIRHLTMEIASVLFHREMDDSLTVETKHLDLTYYSC